MGGNSWSPQRLGALNVALPSAQTSSLSPKGPDIAGNKPGIGESQVFKAPTRGLGL